MTDTEIIAELNTKALAIMREPPATQTGEPLVRASRLEQAHGYLICCAILTGELNYDDLKKLDKTE